MDHAGNQVIADHGNQRIRVVAADTGTFYGQAMTAGNIYTVAGDGRAAARAEVGFPSGVAADGHNLLISDNRRTRMVTG